MVEIIASAIKNHVVHLERIIDIGGIRIPKLEQLRRRIERDVEVAPRESSREVVVIATQIVTPLKLLAGGMLAPQVIRAHEDRDRQKHSTTGNRHLFRLALSSGA